MKKSILLLAVLFIALCACRERPEGADERGSSHKTEATAPAPESKPGENPALEPVAETSPTITDSTSTIVKDSTAVQSDDAKEKIESAPKPSTAEQQPQKSQGTELVLDLVKTTVLIGGICLVFLILIYAVYRKLNKEIKGFRASFNRTKQGDRIGDVERKIKEMQNQLNSIQNTRSNYASRSDRSPMEQRTSGEFIVRNETSTPIEQTLYFSAPRRFDNGAVGFDTSKAKSSFVPSQSKYRLTPNDDRTTARFDLVADNFADMINIPQDFVDPICRAEGQSTNNTRRVACLQPGQARLMDGNWIVTEKMIVKYE